MFAWCLVVQGGLSPQAAQSQAEQLYRYEATSEPLRGLVFHDQAWHWAMLTLLGEHYWLAHPDLAKPSTSYCVEEERYARRAVLRLPHPTTS